MNQIQHNLTVAQDLIRDPAHWTQGTFARDAQGNPVDHERPLTGACSFCAIGALAMAMGVRTLNVFDSPELNLLAQAIGQQDDGAVYDFNDRSTHAGVMEMFDRAKELANEPCS